MNGSDGPRARAEEIFHRARELEGEARARYLDEACAGDERLRVEVDSLLDELDSLGDFLEEPAFAPLDVPSTIGPYRLVSTLGRGGMGEVWLAEQDEPIRRRVAIKVIRPGMDTRSIVRRFEAERQAMAMMDHPGVARVFDAGTTANGQPFFAMEYVQGVPITDYARERKLSIRERIQLFQQVCEAIEHAHQKTILHRDVKPSNVLVTEIDGRPQVKVIDFGVAKALDERLGTDTILTAHGSVIGTPEYMSPEQAGMIDGAVDTRSDVYSLGLLLFELLVGALPIDAERVREAMSMGIRSALDLHDTPTPLVRLQMLGERREEIAARRRTTLSELESAIRGELEWITMTAIAVEPERRFQSASALAADLQRHLDGESVVTAPPSRTYRARKFVRRHRAAVGTVAVISFGLVLGAAGLAYGLVRALEAEERASQEARTSDEVVDFLVDLFRVNEPGAAADTLVTAREILDRGAGDIRERLGDDPLVRGDLLNSMSKAYWGLGLYPQADTLASQSVADLERVLDPADERVSDARRQWSLSRFYGGDYRSALEIAEEAFEIRAAAFGPHDEIALSLRNVRAQLVARIGDPDAAREEFLDMIAYLEGGSGDAVHRALVTAWNNLASVHFRGSDFDRARVALERALAVFDSTGLDDEPRRIQLMINISGTKANLGDFEGASAMLEEALPEIDRVFGPNHMEAVGARMNRAVFRQLQGDAEGAIAGYADVVPRAEAALGPRHPQVAAILHNQGSALVDAGRYEEAIAPFERAHEIRVEVLDSNHDLTLRSLLGTAIARAGADDLSTARRAFATFRRELADKGGSEDPKVAADLDVYADVLEAAGHESDAVSARDLVAEIRGEREDG